MKTKEEIASERYDELGYNSESFADFNDKDLWMEGYVRAMNDAQQDWIPVEVRLPEDDSDVYVTVKEMDELFVAESYYMAYEGEPRWATYYNIIAWMPKPLSPQPYNPKQS